MRLFSNGKGVQVGVNERFGKRRLRWPSRFLGFLDWPSGKTKTIGGGGGSRWTSELVAFGLNRRAP